MKGIIFGLILVIAGFAQAGEKLSMSKDQWAKYKDARDAKDWALAESLTVFPDVKAWDANNQGQNKFIDEDYDGAKADFERALKYADEADKVGRGDKLGTLRETVKKALALIEENNN